MVVVRNANRDYNYGQVTVTSTTTFTLTTDNVGGTSGTDAAYIACPYVSTFSTQASATISAPGGGLAGMTSQIISVKLTTGFKSTTTFALTVPVSLTNGAGGNNDFFDMNPPIASAWKYSDGGNITGIGPTVAVGSAGSGFNTFTLGALNSGQTSLLLKFTF